MKEKGCINGFISPGKVHKVSTLVLAVVSRFVYDLSLMCPTRFIAFGLVIDTSIDLPELIPYTGDRDSDVHIRVGPVARHLEDPLLRGVLFEVCGDQFLLRIDGVANYRVEEGERITIDPVAGCDEKEVRVFLFTSVFGALLHQRGYLPLHASSVACKGQAFVFCGPSGVGKSTLAAALSRRGYDLIADDISVVNLDHSKHPYVFPGYPRLKLWRDVMDHLGHESEEPLRLYKEIEKYSLPLQNLVTTPVPIKTIYSLGVVHIQEHESLEPIKGHYKVASLTSNTYRGRLLKGMVVGNRHFIQVNTIAQATRMISVKRTACLDRMEVLMDLLEEDFQV